MKLKYDPSEEPERARKAHTVATRTALSLQNSLDELSPDAPFTAVWVQAADRERKLLIDAFLKRFENVVGAGGKLFRAALFQAGDDHRSLSPLEIEARLEQYGLIASSDRWRQLVGVRNISVHDYSDTPEELAEGLSEAFEAASEANKIVRHLLSELRRRFPDTSPQESGE